MTGKTVSAVFDAAAELVPELRTGLVKRRETLDSKNASGDVQLAADEWADRRFAEKLTAIDGVGAYASEERDEVLHCGEGLSVAVDPLDGSSNLRSNNPVGSILGVYDEPLPTSGRNIVAGGFFLYGSTTTLTLARDGTVRTEVVADGTRQPVETDVRLPEDPTVYGFGGGSDSWRPEFQEYADGVTSELKLRYSGSLVADVSQVLTYGGVFGYPGLRSRPDGKLRAQFEAAPMGAIFEAAGGRSSDGTQSLLDIPITDLHERTPLFVGSTEYIERLERTVVREMVQ
jgi:fructose-1,6-bisphosphatase I